VTCTAGLLSIFGVPFTTGRVAAAASRWIRRFPNPSSAVFYALVLAKIAALITQLVIVIKNKPAGC
jgi:hypothetical protein